MLYLPSYWFHFIVSQDASIQCNARSGDSVLGLADIVTCGKTGKAKMDAKGKIKMRQYQNEGKSVDGETESYAEEIYEDTASDTGKVKDRRVNLRGPGTYTKLKNAGLSLVHSRTSRLNHKWSVEE